MIIILNLHSGTKLSGWLRHWLELRGDNSNENLQNYILSV